MAIYLKIDKFDGHVTAKGYEKWIEIETFHHSVERNISTRPGNVADREATKPSFSELMVTKKLDKTSPKLFEQACVGKALPKVEIHLCLTGPDKISPYTQYTLQNVIISRYETLGEQGCERGAPSEQLYLNFDKIEVKYIPYDAQHNAGSPIPAGYDLAAGTKV